MRRGLFALPLLMIISGSYGAKVEPTDPRLKGAYRLAPRDGWTFVHLEGAPNEIGFQHGWLLSKEIKDGFDVQKLEAEHDLKHPWNFFRDAGKQMLWPKIPAEYQEELKGIAAGLAARGVALDLWDVVALNASLEWSYYTEAYDKQHGVKAPKTATAPEHCSAFVATGSYTKDGKVVIAHNNWTAYLDGERWTMIFDIAPAKGHRFVMDGYPGLIHSADDFGVNDAGIAITETTITAFHGWDSNGIAEFARARRAMQYSASIDDFDRLMREGNNGGYANNWLVADTKTNEVASLELGLKNVALRRTKDGYFTGANFPVNAALLKEETTFNPKDMSLSANTRRVRWEQLMKENKGRIDSTMAKAFLSDHYDVVAKKTVPSEHTLCGHNELSPRGMPDWKKAYEPAGAVQNKVADAESIAKMSFSAGAGHACGIHFKAASHLAAHPEFQWQSALLRDMDSHPWAVFRAGEK
ncbi:MAG TPA: C45 family peptidase [Bryobacteraceae bacterium]|nr:C45 family peptidase [Bryobacteraceae bacterium]